MTKLNLGCGTDVRDGWVNVDTYPVSPVVIKADVEIGLPFEDGSFDSILASHVLEHVVRFDRAWNDIHRVLKTFGTIEVHVPYGYNTDPYHIRYFDLNTVKRLTAYNDHTAICGNERRMCFILVGKPSIRVVLPFAWHIQRYLEFEIPNTIQGTRFFPGKKDLHFTLQKVL